MKNKWLFLIIIIVCIALFAGAVVLYNSLKDDYASNNLVENDTETIADDFTVYDQNGKEVKLSDYRGKPVVVNFWASWCGNCKDELPDFEKMYREFGNEVQFLMINLTDGTRETVEIASDFITEKGYTFPIVYDKKLSATSTYSVNSIPSTYFIDAQGHLDAQVIGEIDENTLRKGIDTIRN